MIKMETNWEKIGFFSVIIIAIIAVQVVPQMGIMRIGPAVENAQVIVFESPVDGEIVRGNSFFLTFKIHIEPENLSSFKVMSYELTLKYYDVERSLLHKENINSSSAFTITKTAQIDATGKYVCALKKDVKWNKKSYSVKKEITFYYEVD